MTKNIYWLQDIQQSDLPAVGGKSSNLGDMARQLRVPPGFCLSSEVYYQHIKHHGLDTKINDYLAGADLNDLSEANKISESITELIMNTPMLPQVEQELTEAFQILSQQNPALKVAIRSSATAEDLADASFAGLQETFLNVSGISDILVSVKRCWASLWTPRAMHYRNHRGIEHLQVKMAVIIQEMVPATISGVMFTANPVTNKRSEIRIEAVRGLGEQLVSGHTAGDVYIVEKDDTHVKLISKEISNPSLGQMLTDYEIRELAHTGLKIELYYENYMDIEWAYASGKVYFLQARPITTLADEELTELDLHKLSELQRELVDWAAERFPEPIYPIDGIVVKLLFMAQFEAMKEFGFTIDDMDWTRIETGTFPEFFIPPRVKPGLKRLWLYLRLGKTLKSDPAEEWSREQVHLLEMLKRLKGRDMSDLPYELITDYISEAFNHLHFFTVMRYRYFSQNRIPTVILSSFLKFLFGEEGAAVYENLQAGSDNVTIRANSALQDLACCVREMPEVNKLFMESEPEQILQKQGKMKGGEAFQEKFDQFMEMYGERETTMGLGGIASPTWNDTPQVVIGIVKAILSEEPEAWESRERTRLTKARAAEDKLYERLSSGIWALLPVKSFIRKVVAHSRSFNAFRENSHYDVTKGLHVFRVLFAEVGRRFIRRGFLNEAEDIYYLTYFEIKDIISTVYFGIEEVNIKALAHKIQARKEERERRLLRWKSRNIKYDANGLVKGVPASQGVITGPARIITDPSDFGRLRKGDILIAHYTNPAWTPLFTTAAGLIVETGGVASHAAIIAREYGIPAVMGVTMATNLFKDGEIITVNGATGNIYRDKD